MPVRTCPFCSAEIDSRATHCPSCGAPVSDLPPSALPQKPRKPRRWLRRLILYPVLAFGAMAVLATVGERAIPLPGGLIQDLNVAGMQARLKSQLDLKQSTSPAKNDTTDIWSGTFAGIRTPYLKTVFCDDDLAGIVMKVPLKPGTPATDQWKAFIASLRHTWGRPTGIDPLPSGTAAASAAARPDQESGPPTIPPGLEGDAFPTDPVSMALVRRGWGVRAIWEKWLSTRTMEVWLAPGRAGPDGRVPLQLLWVFIGTESSNGECVPSSSDQPPAASAAKGEKVSSPVSVQTPDAGPAAPVVPPPPVPAPMPDLPSMHARSAVPLGPDPLVWDVEAHWTRDGLVVSGQTRLPEGTKLTPTVLPPRENGRYVDESSAVVQGGRFQSDGMTYFGAAIPQGTYRIEIEADFGGAQHQPANALDFAGPDGLKLSLGPQVAPNEFSSEARVVKAMFKLNLSIDGTPFVTGSTEGLTGAAGAIARVQSDRLTVEGSGRSARDVIDVVMYYRMDHQVLDDGFKWSAVASGADWIVTFDYLDGSENPQKANWKYSPATDAVQYLDAHAKMLSYAPPPPTPETPYVDPDASPSGSATADDASDSTTPSVTYHHHHHRSILRILTHHYHHHHRW